jgi:hypothetical protein
MSNDPLKDRRDPTHHKWRPWEERNRLREERRGRRADIIVIGEVVILEIAVMVLLAVVHFLSKIVTGIS